LPGGKLIDRIQKITRNVADRQHLNNRRLRPCIIRSSAPVTSCPQIKLSLPFPAISHRSVVGYLYSLFRLRERLGKVSKKVSKNPETIDSVARCRASSLATQTKFPFHVASAETLKVNRVNLFSKTVQDIRDSHRFQMCVASA